MMTVEINGLRLYAYHGVMEQEKRVGNEFEINMSLRCVSDDAGRNDDLSTTVNYAEVIDTIREVMATPSLLLENVAWRLREEITRRFPLVSGGSVNVRKLTPPCGVQLHHVGVTLEW